MLHLGLVIIVWFVIIYLGICLVGGLFGFNFAFMLILLALICFSCEDRCRIERLEKIARLMQNASDSMEEK